MPYLSVDYMWYKNKAIIIDNYTFSGTTAGIKTGLILECMFAPPFSFGVDVSYMSAVLTEYTIENDNTKTDVKLTGEDYENISRLDFSAGFRYSF